MTKTVLPGFTAPTRQRWTGDPLPVLYEGDRHCRRCTHGLVIRVGTFRQKALFYHGGYGADEVKEVEQCLACGTPIVRSIRTANPRDV